MEKKDTPIASTQAKYDPLCPHCEKAIDEVHWREIKAFLQTEYIFLCPHCRKVIGVTASRS